jgi:glycosyltransferase involved in cell wall biosynthesis
MQAAPDIEDAKAVSPLVSAIIPTYNRAALVCQAIDSIRQQTYGNIEIVVVDDGSTDDTLQRLEVYGNAIRVISQANAGPSAARNRGIRAARGEIVTFLDSDDVWHPTKVARQVGLLQRTGAPCCICNAEIEDGEDGEVRTFEYAALRPAAEEGVWENVTEVLSTRFLMLTQMVAIRRSVLERIGGFDESLWLLEDYDLALRLSLEGPWCYIATPLVTYRRGTADSLSTAGEADALRVVEGSLRARCNLYDIVVADRRHQHLRPVVERSVRAARRERTAVALSRRSSWPGAAIGAAAMRLARLEKALYRRSPWYPQMRVRPVVPDARGIEDRVSVSRSWQ